MKALDVVEGFARYMREHAAPDYIKAHPEEYAALLKSRAKLSDELADLLEVEGWSEEDISLISSLTFFLLVAHKPNPDLTTKGAL